MANNVDIGCGDNKDAIIGSYEAIKVNGTKLDTDVDNVSITQFVSIPNRGSCAIGLRFGTRYYVSIFSCVTTTMKESDASFATEIINGTWLNFSCSYTSDTFRCSIFSIDDYGTQGDLFSDLDVEFYYLTANSYNNLIAQLGGGIALTCHISLLRRMKYGKYCGYGLYYKRWRFCSW